MFLQKFNQRWTCDMYKNKAWMNCARLPYYGMMVEKKYAADVESSSSLSTVGDSLLHLFTSALILYCLHVHPYLGGYKETSTMNLLQDIQ